MIKLHATDDQDALNKSYLALMRQGEKSGCGANCFYTSSDGRLACGIGHLLPPMARNSFDMLDHGAAIEFLAAFRYVDIGSLNLNLLESIQGTHDSLPDVNDTQEFREALTKCFKLLAEEYGLTLNEYKPGD